MTDVLNQPSQLKPDIKLEKKVPVEVYSRVVGYFRPIDYWNPGKRAEFNERLEYLVNEEMLNKKIRGRYDKNN